MKNLNLDQFQEILKIGTLKILKNIFETVGKDNINGFCLYSDSDASSISAAYNTKDYLVKKCNADPDEDFEYFKWYPAEWKEEGLPSVELDALSKMLFEISTSDNLSFAEYRKEIFSAILNSLLQLKEENLFLDLRDDFILVFYASDYFVASEEIEWIKKLNSTDKSNEFENWRNKSL
ncbi:DUF4303 domain-containing protein [Flavobacterium amniphilum]|uniref:DUF4303 domain-containing protein n=1 Tax=Flavobacterium amniphilum TaxID=1834035 RepID=UPI002029B89D|nr:DUF4303 domain-containing protein [Flavobacterium amniphilum]MCL9807528.1 DUF4303 domain-containing protein [Flavobacterium amniphilum]